MRVGAGPRHATFMDFCVTLSLDASCNALLFALVHSGIDFGTLWGSTWPPRCYLFPLRGFRVAFWVAPQPRLPSQRGSRTKQTHRKGSQRTYLRSPNSKRDEKRVGRISTCTETHTHTFAHTFYIYIYINPLSGMSL